MLMLDVKDAFDAILPGRLVRQTIRGFTSSNLSSKPNKSNKTQKSGLEDSIYAPSNATVASTLPKLPPPIRLVGSQPRIRTGQRLKVLENAADYRIFVRLQEGHISRQHHTHAVKAALTQKLGLNDRPIKGVQHVKSGLTILPADANQAAQKLEKAPEITAALGGIIEKAEKWHNYLLDHVPMKINCFDKTTVEVTPEIALEEIKFELGVVPKRIAWTKKCISNPGQVDVEEVHRCLQVSGTSLGSDLITVKILESCWESIKEISIRLFGKLLIIGYHPKVFKSAERYLYTKNQQKRFHSPSILAPNFPTFLPQERARKTGRPTCQSCSDHPKSAAHSVIWGSRKRSITDPVSCLIHDVKKDRARRHVASLLKMNIKGAFDTVLPGRIQNRLCAQGWPGWLIRWVTSFIGSRSVKVRFEDFITHDELLTFDITTLSGNN
ncbi:hypothetical protein EPUL_004316, partial [Erysiphe pulchra]